MFAGNDEAIALVTNPLASARTKLIDVRFHFILKLVRLKALSVKYVSTKKQLADILTKAVVGADFKAHRGSLMNGRM